MKNKNSGKSTVDITLEIFQSHEETACLMDSPKNAERLSQAISDINKGKMIQHGLIEE